MKAFARRLWCRVVGHHWNVTSISEPTYMHNEGGLYRCLTGRQCLRCGEPGPVSWWTFDPIATYAELERLRHGVEGRP